MKGKVLDSKQIALDAPFIPKDNSFNFTDTENLKKFGIIGFIVIIILILSIMFVSRRGGSGALMLLIAITSFVYSPSPKEVEAATIHLPYLCKVGDRRVTNATEAQSLGCLLHPRFNRWMFPYDNGTIAAVADEAYTAVNLNKNTCYNAGEEIDVTATGWVKAKCGNGAPGWVDVTINGDTQRLIEYTPPNGGEAYTTEDFTPGFGTFIAPDAPGEYFADVILVNTHGGVMSGRAQIPYSVCQPANVDATCGTANGGNFQNTPSTNLCGQGEGLVGSVTQNADGTKSWSWTCGGRGTGNDAVCSTNSCSANYGEACQSDANVCGATASGVYSCSGQCVNSLAGNTVLGIPDVGVTNPTYNDVKVSAPNACGATNTTRGTCDAAAPTPAVPSGSICPGGPGGGGGTLPGTFGDEGSPFCITDSDPTTATPSSINVPAGGVIRPSAVDEEGNIIPLGEPFRIEGNPSSYKVGDKCQVFNPSCSSQAPNESYVTCDGTCAVAQPFCGGVQCISRGNIEGKTNTIFVETAEQCIELAVVPSDSVCEIPSFGFRTKNGLYTVDAGTEKTLVWDTVLNATSCIITGPDNVTLAVINDHIRDTSRPQPGHAWTNILPSGEVATGPINQTSEYEMTCINVDSPEVTERLRITLTPNIIEN